MSHNPKSKKHGNNKKISAFFCFSSLLCLLFTTNQTMSESDHMDTFCIESSANFTRNSTYHTNLNTLLSTLSNQSSFSSYYILTTGLASDTVHGSFLCTGDVNRTTCNTCVKAATIEIAKNCTNKREAIIYYIDCMVRYSDKYFFLDLDTYPYSLWWSDDPTPKKLGNFGEKLSKKMLEVIDLASLLSTSYTPYYQMDVTQYEGSYDLSSIAQCNPHLDAINCTVCLKIAWKDITDCCNNSLWAATFSPDCFVSFDISSTSVLPPPPPPPEKQKRSDSFSIRGEQI